MRAANPRRTPSQARSKVTVEAIYEACIQVFHKSGPESLTTSRVAERAGVSVGTLYQYFPDKQAMMLALLERHLLRIADFVSAVCEENKGQTLDEMVPHIVDAMIGAKMARADEALALYPITLEAQGAALVNRVLHQGQLAICDALASAAGVRFTDLRMVSFIFGTAVMAPLQAVLAAGAAPPLVDALRQHLGLMLTAYAKSVAVPVTGQSG